MLEKIVKSTLKHRQVVLFALLALVIAGVYSFVTLPVDAFPDVTNVQVEVVCHADGLSAIEIERSVTHPVEMVMRGLPQVEQLRSVTKFGLAVITIVFKEEIDVYFARQLVFERLAEARESIPVHAEISMGPVATAMGEIYQYTLRGTVPEDSLARRQYYTKLRTLQEWIITPMLKSVDGVNEINSFGGYFKQYQVTVWPEKLLQYNCTVEDVFAAIQENNQDAGGNTFESYSEQFIIRCTGLIKDTNDIGAIVLKAHKGIPVYLKDVADISIGEAVRQGAALVNGSEEAVGGIVMMLKGGNGKEVVEKVKQKVQEINNNNVLPDGITIVPYYDRSEIVESSITTVGRALLEGSVLVLIILYVLLRSFRGAAVVLVALPLSLLVTFGIMKITGIGANLMSLGGLAISIGMIIDATIIQVENVQRHIAEDTVGSRDFSAIVQAVLEVRKPSIFGELIIAITFIPIISLEGIEGKMFAPLAITVAIALAASLLLSLLVIPVLCALLLKPGQEKESVVMHYANKLYLPVLQRGLLNSKPVLAVAVLLLGLSIFIIPRLGTEFMPVMDEGAFDMDVSMLPGVPLDKALEANKLVGQKLASFHELETVVSRTGQTGVALDTRGPDKTGYVGILRPQSEWKHKQSREELTSQMREALSGIPGIAYSFSQPIQCRIDELVAGTKAQLIIKLFGENLDTLRTTADKIVKVLSTIEGCTDLQAEKVSGQPYLTIQLNRARIARYGLNISEIQKSIEIAIAGKDASNVYEENKSFAISVRFPETRRNSAEAIGNLLISTPDGGRIPLSELADLEISEGPVQISRENGQRRIGIELNIENRDIGGFVAEAKQKIAAHIPLPDGYYVTWGGQFENQERAMNKLLLIGPAAIGLIFLLLFFSFGNVRHAMLVLLNLPFALIGGVLSLWISGLYLSVPASVGFIVLFGVAVLNGLVLVSHITEVRKQEGITLHEAIIQGCTDRLRPVLMTALIAIFSLVPMLFATGSGSEIQKPLATVVVGGLVTSTLLTLLLLPALYAKVEMRVLRKKQ